MLVNQTNTKMQKEGGECLAGVVQANRSDFQPIFIVGFPRSGTTLLAVLLDRHPLMTIGPESHFIEAAESIKLPPIIRQPKLWIPKLLHLPRLRDLGISPELVLSQLPPNQAITTAALFEAILRAYATRQSKTVIGEKTPSHLLHLSTLFNWFPNAKALCMVRDGRDAVASYLQVPWRSHSSARILGLQWGKYMQHTEAAMRQFPGRIMMVRYENLGQQPENTLRAVDDFIGIPFHAAQLDSALSTEVMPRWETQWKAAAVDPPDAHHIGLWKNRLQPQEKKILQRTMYRSLQKAGYLSPQEESGLKGIRNVLNINLLVRRGFFRNLYLQIVRYSPTYRLRESSYPRTTEPRA
jgi:Sulfotransferase family